MERIKSLKMRGLKIKWLLVVVGITFISCKKIEQKKPAENNNLNVQSQPEQGFTQNQELPIHHFIDQWTYSGSLSEFKKNILINIDRGNQNEILSTFSELLEINPGTAKGGQGIIETWGLNGGSEKLKPLQFLLKNLISGGGCIGQLENDSTFTSPYYNCFSDQEKVKYNSSDIGIVTQVGAEMYAEPDSNLKIMTTLHPNEIVPSYLDTLCDEHFSNCLWRKINRNNGQIGFIKTEKLQTKNDGFLWLVKEKNAWKIRVIKGPGINSDDI